MKRKLGSIGVVGTVTDVAASAEETEARTH